MGRIMIEKKISFFLKISKVVFLGSFYIFISHCTTPQPEEGTGALWDGCGA
jgi:hypothetical protein